MNAEDLAVRTPNVWLLAARPRTLPIAVAPVIVGTAVAFAEGVADWLPALAALAVALLVQIGANLANDVYDFQQGKDTGERLGPLRVSQAGLLKPNQVKQGMWITFAIAGLIGLYLAWHAGWPVLLLGAASILAAITYTAGPYPIGYNGLGEVFVFLFFGLVAVGGTYFVQAGTLSWQSVVAAIPIGLLAAAVLVVNNIRDVDTDRKTGKMTLAARFGVTWARQEFVSLMALAYLITFLMGLTNVSQPWVVLTWLSLPVVFTLGKLVYTQKGKPLNQALAMTSQLELIFALLFALAMVIGRYFAF